MKEQLSPNSYEDGVPQFEEFPHTGKEGAVRQANIDKEQFERKEEKAYKQKLFRNFYWGFLLGLNTLAVGKILSPSSEKNLARDEKEVYETSVTTPEQGLSNNAKLVYFFANNEVYEMRGRELKDILMKTSDADLVESFYRGRIATSQYLQEKVTDQYPAHDNLVNVFKDEFGQLDSLQRLVTDIYWKESNQDAVSPVDQQHMDEIHAEINSLLANPIIKVAYEEKLRYEQLWAEYDWTQIQGNNLSTSMKEMESNPEKVRSLAADIRNYLNYVINEYERQAQWISNIVQSEEYKNKLLEESVDMTDSIYRLRMSQINSDFLIFNTRGFNTDGGTYDNALAFYSSGTKEIYMPTGAEDKASYMYANRDANDIETVGIHEMTHQLTDAEILMSSYAKNLYSKSFDATRLTPYELEDVLYFLDPTERDARKKVLEYEMDQLGIKKYGEPFTDKHLEILEKFQKEGVLSRGSDEFLRMTKKEYLIQIMNTIARNQTEVEEEMLYASFVDGKNDTEKNIHLFELANPEKAKVMRETLINSLEYNA